MFRQSTVQSAMFEHVGVEVSPPPLTSSLHWHPEHDGLQFWQACVQHPFVHEVHVVAHDPQSALHVLAVSPAARQHV